MSTEYNEVRTECNEVSAEYNDLTTDYHEVSTEYRDQKYDKTVMAFHIFTFAVVICLKSLILYFIAIPYDRLISSISHVQSIDYK